MKMKMKWTEFRNHVDVMRVSNFFFISFLSSCVWMDVWTRCVRVFSFFIHVDAYDGASTFHFHLIQRRNEMQKKWLVVENEMELHT